MKFTFSGILLFGPRDGNPPYERMKKRKVLRGSEIMRLGLAWIVLVSMWILQTEVP
jgi:hypothetical protein